MNIFLKILKSRLVYIIVYHSGVNSGVNSGD